MDVSTKPEPRGHAEALLEARLRAVREIAWAVGSSMELDTILQVVMVHVTRLVEAERSTLFIVDADRGELWSKVLQGEENTPSSIDATRAQEIRLPLGHGVAGWVAVHGQLVRLDDPYRDPRFDAIWDRTTDYRTRALL